MAKMLTQQLWLKVVSLTQNSMSTNYSFQNLASDLSSILSEISKKCASFDPEIINKLHAAKAWADTGQHEQSLGSLYAAYQELAKKYLSAVNASLSTGNYLIELIEISATTEAFGVEYQSILEHGVSVADSSKRGDLKNYCSRMLANEGDFQAIFQRRKVNFDSARKYLTEVVKIVS